MTAQNDVPAADRFFHALVQGDGAALRGVLTSDSAYRTCRWAPMLALLLVAGAPLESQAPAAVARVQWSLIDVVMVTDSCYGVWLLAAPNVRTSNWDRGSQIVSSRWIR